MAQQTERVIDIGHYFKPPHNYGHPSTTNFPHTEQHSLQKALEQNELERYEQFVKGRENVLPPWKYLIHPERMFGGSVATGFYPLPIVGEKILSWSSDRRYMRLEVYAEGHHFGSGRLIDNGWRGAETVWERSVYFHHQDDEVVIKNDVYFCHYPKSIALLLPLFADAILQRNEAKKAEIRALVQSSGYDVVFTNCGVRVCVPNISQMHTLRF